MLVNEDEKLVLRDWLIPKLEKISDADAGVLADYVIALVTSDETDDANSVKKTCLNDLTDFLQDHTEPFVDEVVSAVQTKSFFPNHQRSPPSAPAAPRLILSAEAAPFNPPSGPSAFSQPYARSSGPSASPEQSRKRRYNEREPSQGRDESDPHYRRGHGNDRPLKQTARRGGRNARGTHGMQSAHEAMPMPAVPQFPDLPTPPPGFPAFDPNNPMSFFSWMSSMALPGMFPPGLAPPTAGQPKGRKKRCRDYDTKGFCARGSTCPYEHGGEIVLPPTDEYDPTQSSLAVPNHTSANGHGQHGRGRSHRGGRARASFSQAGANYDRSNSTIVVEQIPEEYFTEEAVRDFFSQFGNILEVDMRAYKRLAIVKYDDYAAARKAYDSPKVIFDNRFVKVYWYKPDSLPKPPAHAKAEDDGAEEAGYGDEEMYDPEEFARRQAEAQKAYEERQKKAQEADARIEEIEQKLKEKAEEMRALQEQLAKKSKKGSVETENLIEQLASLQSEAQGLNADYDTYSFRGRGRGGYRGRGSFAPRARGYSTYRGGYRGRGYGSPFAAAGRSSVRRLDNRPKRIAVSGIEPGSKQDETLREHLVNRYDYESIEADPSKASTQIISFKERYMAEVFLGEALTIPDIGKIELAWVPNAATTAASTMTKTGATETEPLTSEADVKMEDAGAEEQPASGAQAGLEVEGDDAPNGGEDNYDVADDEDRWLSQAV